MEKTAQEAKLKSGKTVGYTKINDEAVFINNVMAKWQVVIIIFILVVSILVAFVQMSFLAEVGNQILEELAIIRHAVAPSGNYVIGTDTLLMGEIGC